ncbi:hypothetical protein AVEN_260065-1 [Araneus ventricosus]|uniref:Uncharacterized protein n=1 Tax=Araneus ventricosus TaxID=182803 RepID=A0A4Y2G577_ARAVE|nr:hypothetical protein AVEN_260065-1 [Araneus ventricosus]
MVCLSVPSLLDLCSIRIAYSMWTRHEVIGSYLSMGEWNRLEDVVLAKVQSLPVPEELKSLVRKILKLAGQHLCILLNLWLPRTWPRNSINCLTENMLFECLTLKGSGLIDHRKTAEKILSSRMLPSVPAFRLACVTFLEVEVLKLWPHVMQYFLNNIFRESEKPPVIDGIRSLMKVLEEQNMPFGTPVSLLKKKWTAYSTEPHEVLFWFTYCLSKEQGTNMQIVPHYVKECTGDKAWYEFIAVTAVISGNVTYFDYYNNSEQENKIFLPKEMTEEILSHTGDFRLASFVSAFMLLTSSEIEDLFQSQAKAMVFLFLQWPLSMTFLEKTEEIWNLIPDEQKELLFAELITILCEGSSIVETMKIYISNYLSKPVLYSFLLNIDHVRRIYFSLWKISSDSHKIGFLNSYVFRSILGFYVGEIDRRERFCSELETNGLKEKLLHLFLANGEAVLELYEGLTIQASLRSLVAKHMPEYFEDLDRGLITFLGATEFQFGWDDRAEMISDDMCILLNRARFQANEWAELYRIGCVISEDFVNYVKEFLLLSNNSFVCAQSLSLPENLKSLVLKPPKPAGQHLLNFLRLWLSKTQPEDSVNWLTEDTLTECLILNDVGLINHRKTAEKILSSRMLPNVFAFRLACVNFLEVDVLKLWPHVMQYLLNRMMLESEKPHVINDKFSFSKLFGAENKQVSPYLPYFDRIRETNSVSYTTEPLEVLFWIIRCLSKEQATNMQEVPYFENDPGWDDSKLIDFFPRKDWNDFILNTGFYSGNVACFDYCNKYWSYKEMTKKISSCHRDILHISFVFHYRLLTSSEIEDLFQTCPRWMGFCFLQWSMSFTFLKKTEEIWNLIPDNKKLITILYEKNDVVDCMTFISDNRWSRTFHFSPLHSFDHVKDIFISLWNISSDSL